MAGFATIPTRPSVPRQFLLAADPVGVTFAAAADAAQITPAPWWRVLAHVAAIPVALLATFAATAFASFEGAVKADKGQKLKVGHCSNLLLTELFLRVCLVAPLP